MAEREKVALLLPGYLDSPDYLHMITFERGLMGLGYIVERLDPCNLWETGDISRYTMTNYLHQIEERVDYYKARNPDEITLTGHSMGGFMAIVAGGRIDDVTKIIALCAPPDRLGAALSWEGKAYRHSTRDLPNNPRKRRSFDVPHSFALDSMQYSAVDEARKLHKPMMLFIAKEDTVCPPKLTEQIVSVAHNPYVVWQEGMGHDFRHSQAECDVVMGHIARFLR